MMYSANLKPLNIDQLNKKILEKKPFVRPDYDLVNVTGNYQDQDYKVYQEKCMKFIEISKKYQEFNEQTFLTSKEKSLKDYENFIERVSGDFFQVEQVKELETATEEYILEPWFKRYLTLNKFIHISRAVIMRNRLLKNLQILKQLDKDKIAELEKNHLKCKNESYQQLFSKFL